MTQLGEEIDRIANNTEFNTKKLLNGNMGKATEAAAGSLENKGALQANLTNDTKLEVLKDINDNILGIEKGDEITATWSVNGSQKSIKYKVVADAKLEDLFNAIEGEGSIDNVEYANGAIKFDAKEAGMTGQINGFSIEVKSANGNRKEAASNALSSFDVKDKATDKRTNGSANLQIGANGGQQLNLSIEDMRATSLGVSNLQVGTQSQANTAINVIDEATKRVSSERANLGAAQNRLEYTISNLDNTAENLTSAESTLRDVDMAKEMMEYSKNNILSQAAQSMISQANQQPQNVLQLLR